VSVKYDGKTTSFSSHSNSKSIQRYGFQIKENEDITLTLYTENEDDRKEWIEVLTEAFTGIEHELISKALIIPSFNDNRQNYGPLSDGSSSSSASIDFPHMEGYLKKTSSGKTTFGLKSVKRRWFRLEGGEIRYYENEDVRPSKLKGVLELLGAEVLTPDNQNSSFIMIQLPNGGRLLKLEATSAKIAKEWREILNETVFILEQHRNIYNSEFKKARRFNVHDHLTEEEKKGKATAVSSGGGSSPHKPSSTSPNRQSLSSPPASPVALPASDGSSSPARKSFFSSNKKSSTPDTAAAASSSANHDNGAVSVPSSSLTRKFSSLLSANDGNDGKSITKSHYKSTQLIEMLKGTLQQHFLLKDLHNMNTLIDSLEEKLVFPGEVIIWQGSIGDLFYVIEKGHCEVVKDGKKVALLTEGKSFGEMALLNSALRQASIRACKACKLWCLNRKVFRMIVGASEKEKLNEKLVFLRTIELFDKLVDSSLEKIAEVMVRKEYVNNDKIIKQGEVGDRFYMIISGRVLVTQQQSSTLAAFSSSSSSSSTSKAVELTRLGPGKYFGEKALLEDSPRKATVTAITSTVSCWTIDRKNFLSLFGTLNEAINESLGIKMLKNVKLLSGKSSHRHCFLSLCLMFLVLGLSEQQLQSIAKCLENKTFVEGEMIIKQGDVGDCFYMIATGEIAVQVNHIQVAILETGSFFGEMSLLSNEKRSATCIALKDSTCLVLSRSNFVEHLGPLDEIMKIESERRSAMLAITGKGNGRRRSSITGSLVNNAGSNDGNEGIMNRLRSISSSFFTSSTTGGGAPSSPSSPTASKHKSLLRSNSIYNSTNGMFSPSSLEKMKKLGFGTFGIVYLVQHNDSGKLYAMKEIRKEHLYSTDNERYVYSEKENLLILSDSMFFPALYSTFHDKHCLYFISQYILGPDLWKLLYSNSLGKTKYGGIPTKDAVFYAVNVLAAIQYMHQHDIIHRDLKPENIVSSLLFLSSLLFN
jgi:cAMP-dependent protein kinase regulator